MNLECSSKGDKRYSSMYAKVTVFDNYDTIENHYQLSKVFTYNGLEVYPNTPKEAKKMQFSKDFTLIGFKVNGVLYSKEYLSAWYKSLWFKYLSSNKHLIDNAIKYDTFTDCFRNGNTVNCQADIIAQVVTQGLGSLYNDCIDFFKMIRNGGKQEMEVSNMKKTFALIIAGSRSFNNYIELERVCDFMLSKKIAEGYAITIISGTAKGADSLGEVYANNRGFGLIRMPADWNKFGKRAGYIRNKEMAIKAFTEFDDGGCIGFRVNNSPGTTHMINLCEELKLKYLVKDYSTN